MCIYTNMRKRRFLSKFLTSYECRNIISEVKYKRKCSLKYTCLGLGPITKPDRNRSQLQATHLSKLKQLRHVIATLSYILEYNLINVDVFSKQRSLLMIVMFRIVLLIQIKFITNIRVNLLLLM